MNEMDRRRKQADEFARLVDGDDSPPGEFAAELRLVDHMRTAGKANPSPEFVAALRQRLIDEANRDRRDQAIIVPLPSRPRRGRLAVAVAATVLLAGGVAASAAMLTQPDPVSCPDCAPLVTPTSSSRPTRPPASTTMPSRPPKPSTKPTLPPNRPAPPTPAPVKPSTPAVRPSARPTTTPSPVLPTLPVPTSPILPSLPSLPAPSLPKLPLPSLPTLTLPLPLPTIIIQLPKLPLGHLDLPQERRRPQR